MSDEKKQSDGNEWNIGSVGGDIVTGDKQTGGIRADNIEGDAIGAQAQTNVAGDVHGDVNTTATGGDYHAQVKEAVAKCEEALVDIFEPLPDPIDETVDVVDDYTERADLPQGDAMPDRSPPAADLIQVDPEYHPTNVFALASTLAENPAEVSEEEQEGFKAKFTGMLKYAGEKGAAALATVGPVAVSVIEASVSPPFPWNLVAAGLKTAVKTIGK